MGWGTHEAGSMTAFFAWTLMGFLTLLLGGLLFCRFLFELQAAWDRGQLNAHVRVCWISETVQGYGRFQGREGSIGLKLGRVSLLERRTGTAGKKTRVESLLDAIPDIIDKVKTIREPGKKEK